MYYRFYRGENVQAAPGRRPQDRWRCDEGRRTRARRRCCRSWSRTSRRSAGLTAESGQHGRRRLRRGGVRGGHQGDPRHPGLLSTSSSWGSSSTAGDYQRTLEVAEAALPLTPGHVLHHRARALPLAGAGRAAGRRRRPARRETPGSRSCGPEEETFRKWAEASPVEPRSPAGAGRGRDRRRWTGTRTAPSISTTGRSSWRARAASFSTRPWPTSARPSFTSAASASQVARGYAQEAWYGYQQWGVEAQAAELAARHGELGNADRGAGAVPGSSVRRPRPARPAPYSSRGLDLVTAVRATQALAGELELGALLERLMRVLIENAGAQKGVLVLNHEDATQDKQVEGRLEVEALVTVEPHRIQIGLRQPLETSTELATSVVQYVARSKETVVLGNAAAESRFARDPYIETAAAASRCSAWPCSTRGGWSASSTSRTTPRRTRSAASGSRSCSSSRRKRRSPSRTPSSTASCGRRPSSCGAPTTRWRSRSPSAPRSCAGRWRSCGARWTWRARSRPSCCPSETRFSDYEVSAVMVPASTVGGDYYDIIRTDGSDWVMIGDVSGHGVTAGLTMMMIQTAIRTVVLGGGEGAAKLTPGEGAGQGQRRGPGQPAEGQRGPLHDDHRPAAARGARSATPGYTRTS